MNHIKKAFMVFAFLAMLVSLSFAATVYVNGTTTCDSGAHANYSTLRSALAAVSAGDTIYVCANGTGAYTEQINIAQAVNITGAQAGVILNYSDPTTHVVNVSADLVNISNITVRDASTDYSGVGILVNGSNGRLYNLTLTHVSTGIKLVGGSNIQVYNNSFTGFSYRGLWFEGYTNYSVAYTNTFYSSGSTAPAIFFGNGDSIFNNVTSNTIRNVSNGIGVLTGNNLSISSNTIYNISGDGIFVYNTVADTNVSYNTLYNCSDTAIYLVDYLGYTPNGIRIFNNTLYSNNGAIYVENQNQSNYVYNNNLSNNYFGITIFGSTGVSVLSNMLYNTTFDALSFINSTVTAFSGNTVTNATRYGVYLEGVTSLAFSGNNEIVSMLSGSYEVYSTENANISTGSYNITTDYLKFLLGTTRNVAIKSVDLNTSIGVNSTSNTISSLANLPNYYSYTNGKVLMYNSWYYGLNVTNTTDSPYFSPYMYYNTTDAAGYTYTKLGRYSSSWNYLDGAASDGVASYTGYSGEFSYFVPIMFSYTSSAGTSTTGTVSSNKYPTIAKTFDCKTGKLEATVTYSGSAISGLTVKLYYTKDFSSVSGTTDSNGKVSFTVTTDGNYELDTVKSGEYSATVLGPFDLTSCNAVPPTQVITTTTTTGTTEETVTEETPSETPEETTTVTTPPTDPAKADAFTALSSADSAISAAAKAGKDVSAAKVKLNAANEALAAGNYAQAKTLAAEAETLAKNAKAASTAPVTQPTTTKPTTQQQGIDMGTILLILVVIIVVVVGIYYLTKGKSSKGYKGHRRV